MADTMFMQYAEAAEEQTDNYITVKQFASLYGVSRQTVWRLLKKYEIRTKKLGTMKLIRREDAMKFFPQMINEQIRIRTRGGLDEKWGERNRAMIRASRDKNGKVEKA